MANPEGQQAQQEHQEATDARMASVVGTVQRLLNHQKDQDQAMNRQIQHNAEQKDMMQQMQSQMHQQQQQLKSELQQQQQQTRADIQGILEALRGIQQMNVSNQDVSMRTANDTVPAAQGRPMGARGDQPSVNQPQANVVGNQASGLSASRSGVVAANATLWSMPAPKFPDVENRGPGYTVDDWLNDLRNTALMGEWTPQVMLFQAMRSTDMETRRKIEKITFPEGETVETAIGRLARAIKGVEEEFRHIAVSMAPEDRIKEGESFTLYADRVVKTYNRILGGHLKYDHHPDTKRVAMMRFCAGLRNTKLSSDLKASILPDTTFEQLVQKAVDINNTTTVLDTVNASQRNQQVRQYSRQYGNDYDIEAIGNRKDIVCFFCRKKGHMKKDCFSKKHQEKGQKNPVQKSTKQNSDKWAKAPKKNNYKGNRQSVGMRNWRRRVQELLQEGPQPEDEQWSDDEGDEQVEEQKVENKDFQNALAE